MRLFTTADHAHSRQYWVCVLVEVVFMASVSWLTLDSTKPVVLLCEHRSLCEVSAQLFLDVWPCLPFLIWLLIVYTLGLVSLLLTSCPQEHYCVVKQGTAIQNLKPYYSQANTPGLCVFSAREGSVMYQFSRLSSTGTKTPQHCPALRLPGEWCHVTVTWWSCDCCVVVTCVCVRGCCV